MILSRRTIHKLTRTDNAANFETLLAEVIVTRKATLMVRSLRLIDFNDSNSDEVSTCKTRERSHDGYCTVGGEVGRSLQEALGCCERALWPSPE